MSDRSSNIGILEAINGLALIDFDQNDALPMLDDDQCLQELESLWLLDKRQTLASHLETLHASVKHQYQLSSKHINASIFTDLLFDMITRLNQVNTQLLYEFTLTKMAFLRTISRDPRFFESSQHFLRSSCSSFFASTVGWYCGPQEHSQLDGKQYQTVIESLANISGKELNLTNGDYDYLQPLNEQMTQFSQAQGSTRQKQLKNYKHSHTQRLVDDFLDGATEGKLFSSIVATFLSTTWRKTLLHYRNEKYYSTSSWDTLCTFTHDFCKLFSVDNNPKSDLIIASIRPNLHKYLLGDMESKEQTIASIVKTINSFKSDLKDDAVKVQPQLELNRLKHINFSSSIISTVASLPKGQWIGFEEGEFKGQKLQLTDKLDEEQVVLLVNLDGSTYTISSVQGLAYKITSKKVHLIHTNNIFENTLSKTIGTYLHRYESRCTEKAEKDEEKILALTKQLRVMEEKNTQLTEKNLNLLSGLNNQHQGMSKKIVLLEADLQAAQNTIGHLETKLLRLKKQKAELEIRHFEELNDLRQVKAEALKQSKDLLASLTVEKTELEKQLELINNENRHHEVSRAVKSLTIGSWLTIIDEAGQPIQCKIAMIYPSSGKHVLVDGKGLAIGEYLEEQLTELLLSEQAQVLQHASKFDDSMESIIKSIK